MTVDTYIVASGQDLYGGMDAPDFGLETPVVATALIGDSLTTHLLGYNWSPFFWINGLAGGPLKLIANAGVAGETVADMYSRVDNDYTDANPGLAGLGALGFVFFRAGTNDARAASSISALAAGYTALLNKIAGYATRVIILSVPPMGSSESSYAAKNALTIQYNAWLEAFAATNPTKFKYVDDSANMRDGAGAQLPGFFQADGIHNAGAATVQEGIDGYAELAAEFAGYAYASPLSTDPLDKYPAQPQWFSNPTMIGTSGGVDSAFSGQAVNGLSIGPNGGGIVCACSVVAADGGDANQTPWQRVAPTQVTRTGGGESIRIASTLAGRTISSIDPPSLDMMFEVRLNALDTTYFGSLTAWVQGSAGALTPDLALKLGGGILSKTLVPRIAMPRISASAHSAATLILDIPISANHTGSMGSFDIRCISIRG